VRIESQEMLMIDNSFLYSEWHMAAWSDEVSDGLFRRRILGEPILLYRKQDGGVAALTDRCPHRFAPLSMGERHGDTVRCPYHGLTFDAGGACVHNPFGDKPPNRAAVRSWPTEERDGIVWLWPGAAEEADSSRIPDFSALIRPCGPPITGTTPMAANYEFGTDNLMDLSHIEFVHLGSFAGNGVIFAGEHSVKQEANTLHSNWWMPDVAAPPHTMGIYERDMRTDHWLDMRWDAPASMYLQVGATPAGRPRDEGIVVHQAHILTPETGTSSHYFWATTRSFDVVDEAMDAQLQALLTQAFESEDKPLIEAAFANLDGGEFWSRNPVFTRVDAGGTLARRLLRDLREQEREARGK
jgi:vanillate O-demethylase monooxygenase subunit